MMSKEERYKFYRSKEWERVRQQALERDNYECQECKRNGRCFTDKHNQDKHKSLDVNHIKDLEHHPKLALHMDNLETLCIKLFIAK
ncbi:HNH endonuclease [Rummeliibacillus suwonensis]|uniref:HNH endonuclease n=1 Tax=Rummeliibacillus suwonensis TaxID=1306154 RepID=UPI00314535D3